MADEIGSIARTGRWVDSRTGAVVDRKPVEGRLLVAPGGVITPRAAALIRTLPTAVAPEPEPVEGRQEPDADVEQATAAPAEETATAPAERETTTAPVAKETAAPRRRAPRSS